MKTVVLRRQHFLVEQYDIQQLQRAKDLSNISDKYVSEILTDADIREWDYSQSNNGKPAVIISAQTGSGKNYFITHTLREYAKVNDQKILYISNRLALNYQQKLELSKLTHTKLRYDEYEDHQNFSNITVLTYKKLYSYFIQDDTKWLNEFRFVVIDECHFFYSDAFFNTDTGNILKKISDFFINSVRIYMSATIDDVILPIRYYECLSRGVFGEDFDKDTFFYEFPKDYSSYQISFFTKEIDVAQKIINDKSKDKWLFFVSSIDTGDKLEKLINEGSGADTAVFLDRRSRQDTEEDVEKIAAWRSLQKNSQFKQKVLLTTSVLDNGFSIKDQAVKNIVICSHDKTECLQELGRVRIKDSNSRVNLYLKKMTKADHATRKSKQERYSELFMDFCGEEDLIPKSKQTNFDSKGDPIRTVKVLWTDRADDRRNLISLNSRDGYLEPTINYMARWRTRRLKEQIDLFEYEQKVSENPSVTYKAKWFNVQDYSVIADMDANKRDIARQELVSFLDKCVSEKTIFHEGGDDFRLLAEKITELYTEIIPVNNRATINRGKNRKNVTHVFVNNRLKELCEGQEYLYQLNGERRVCLLEKEGKEAH